MVPNIKRYLIFKLKFTLNGIVILKILTIIIMEKKEDQNQKEVLTDNPIKDLLIDNLNKTAILPQQRKEEVKWIENMILSLNLVLKIPTNLLLNKIKYQKAL